MPPSTRRTTLVRVVLALLFAYVLPSLVLGQAYYWRDPFMNPKTVTEAAIFGGPSLAMGLVMGWPYVVGAAGCWAVLDQFDRHYLWSAALVGLAAGAGVAINSPPSQGPGHMGFCVALGLVTGLGVWWIAYGRQGRLPAPIPPQGRLVL